MGERSADVDSRLPHAEVIFDPTGEITARLIAERDRPVARPGGVESPTDAMDPELAALRRQIVDPVVSALLSADEVDELALRWGADPLPDDVWVHLVARGEPFEHLLHSPVHGAGPIDAVAAAQNLAWQLEDFIAESRFAWGEQRIARYELPDPG
jgi:hypothetical protein